MAGITVIGQGNDVGDQQRDQASNSIGCIYPFSFPLLLLFHFVVIAFVSDST